MSDTILKGESGANDPVGIALMASLLAAGGLSAGAFGQVGGEFLLQMGVGAAVGIAGGAALLWFMRRVPLPGEGLYPLRTLACALLLFAAATLAHGSGFLAVFAAGIVLGDGRAPYKRGDRAVPLGAGQPRRDRRVRGARASPSTWAWSAGDAWVPGLVLGAALAFVIRPVLVGLCLVPAQLRRGERAFILFAGSEGGRADPARQLPARRRRAGRAAPVRHRRGGRRGSPSSCRAAWCPRPPACCACRCARSSPSRGRWGSGCETNRPASTTSPSPPGPPPTAAPSTSCQAFRRRVG